MDSRQWVLREEQKKYVMVQKEGTLQRFVCEGLTERRPTMRGANFIDHTTNASRSGRKALTKELSMVQDTTLVCQDGDHMYA